MSVDTRSAAGILMYGNSARSTAHLGLTGNGLSYGVVRIDFGMQICTYTEKHERLQLNFMFTSLCVGCNTVLLACLLLAQQKLYCLII